jgi:hypothetical protein
MIPGFRFIAATGMRRGELLAELCRILGDEVDQAAL